MPGGRGRVCKSCVSFRPRASGRVRKSSLPCSEPVLVFQVACARPGTSSVSPLFRTRAGASGRVCQAGYVPDSPLFRTRVGASGRMCQLGWGLSQLHFYFVLPWPHFILHFFWVLMLPNTSNHTIELLGSKSVTTESMSESP